MAMIQSDLKYWMQNVVLPYWAKHGRNPDTGLFYERLDASGKPDLSANLRIRVQFRQIYVFSHAFVMGWCDEGARIALQAWHAVEARFRHPEGGFIHIADAQGHVLDSRRDSYDHAFAVLALSWLFRSTGDAGVRREIDEVLAYVDRALTDAHGTLLEGEPHALPRRQNPQMHWFEAMLALHEAVGHPEAAPRAHRFRALLEERLFHAPSGTLSEYFTQDWQDYPGSLSGSVEPGHQAEWTWLLRGYEKRFGLPAGPLAARLLETALATADPANGLLVDEVDRALLLRRGTRRSWLQTELAKAWIAEAEAGRPGAREAAQAALANLDRYFLRQPFEEGWIDQLDEQARPMAGPVPASTLYHIIVAVIEADRVLGDAGAASHRVE